MIVHDRTPPWDDPRHGDRELVCPFLLQYAPAGSSSTGSGLAITSSGAIISPVLGLKKDDRLKSIKVVIEKSTTDTTTLQAFRNNAGTATAIGSPITCSATGKTEVVVPISGATYIDGVSGYVVLNEDVITIAVTAPAPSGTDYFFSITPLYDRWAKHYAIPPDTLESDS